MNLALYSTVFDQIQSLFSEPEHYVIGSSVIAVYFASGHLRPIARAIAHRQRAATSSHLTLYVWDTASTGVPMIPSPFRTDQFGTRREIKTATDDGVSVTYDVWSGVLSLVHFERNEAIWWCHDVRDLPQYERAAPFRTILQQWFAKRGGQFVHTAAVGTEYNAVLLTGKGGSGKSTTALHCLLDGLNFIGEDYCLIDDQQRVYSVYSSAKLTPHSLTRLPQLVAEWDEGEEKGVVWLHPMFAIGDNRPISAILLPTIVDQTNTTLKRTTAAAALRALAPTTLFQLAGAGQSAFQRMAKIAQTLPVFELQLGEDSASITSTIRSVLEGNVC